MKKFKLLALAIVLGTTSLFANPIDFNVDEDINKAIRTQIVELLDAPDFALVNEMTVNLTFTFNSEGEIVVLNVDTKNRNVLNYIRKNINGQKLESPGKKDSIYTMPLKMKEK